MPCCKITMVAAWVGSTVLSLSNAGTFNGTSSPSSIFSKMFFIPVMFDSSCSRLLGLEEELPRILSLIEFFLDRPGLSCPSRRLSIAKHLIDDCNCWKRYICRADGTVKPPNFENIFSPAIQDKILSFYRFHGSVNWKGNSSDSLQSPSSMQTHHPSPLIIDRFSAVLRIEGKLCRPQYTVFHISRSVR